MKKILLKDIWPIDDVQAYKGHFASRNKKNVQPLDEWVRNPTAWEDWQRHFPGRNDFNRTYIFSLMDFYPEEDIWLFGGVFCVIGLHEIDPHKKKYKVELTEEGEQFIGRLKLRRHLDARQRRVKLEEHYDNLEVSEILAEPYSGRTFPRYEKVNIHFRELESLVKIDRPDWKAALANVSRACGVDGRPTSRRATVATRGSRRRPAITARNTRGATSYSPCWSSLLSGHRKRSLEIVRPSGNRSC